MKTTKNKKIKGINSFTNFVSYCTLFVLPGCGLWGNEKKIRKIISMPRENQRLAEAADEYEDREEEDPQDDQNGIENKGYNSSSENEDEDLEQEDAIEPSARETNESTNPSTISVRKNTKEPKKKLVLGKNNDVAKPNKLAEIIQNEQNKKRTDAEKNREPDKNTIDPNLEVSDQNLQNSKKPEDKETANSKASTEPLQDQENRSLDQETVTLEELKEKISELEKIYKSYNRIYKIYKKNKDKKFSSQFDSHKKDIEKIKKNYDDVLRKRNNYKETDRAAYMQDVAKLVEAETNLLNYDIKTINEVKNKK